MAQLCVCHGSSIPEETQILGAKLKKEHGDFLAGGNRDVQHSCLRASAESQSSDCWQELSEEKEAGITNPLLIPFLFSNPSPALTIFENTASRLLLQCLKKKNLSSRENCFASPIFLWL